MIYRITQKIPFFRKYLPERRDFLLKYMPKNSVCAEIGVWRGDFSNRILHLVSPKELHLIDPWKFQSEYPSTWFGGVKVKSQSDMDNIYNQLVKNLAKYQNVIFHRDFSQKAVDDFKDNYFDWVYIDGNHFYDYVKQDLELYLGKVRTGGFICGDDYEWIDEGDYPVKKAVEEFVNSGLVDLIEVRRGNFILKKC